MSSSMQRVKPPPSLWQDAALSAEPPPSHTAEVALASDPRQRATREVTGRGARARVPVSRIDADPRNPRAPTPQEISDLAASLTAHGLLQPIVVRPVGQRYVVVAGHRRLGA